MTDDGDDARDRSRSLTRRRLLELGAPIAAGTLAGCEQSSRGGRRSTDGGTHRSGDATDRPSAVSPDRSTTSGPPLEPPGHKRPLGEKYPGLRVLDTWRAGEAKDRGVYARYTTPVEDHYVVSHFETPVLDAGAHTVSVTGVGGETVELGVRALVDGYPEATVTHTMQCAGNGRGYFADVDGWDFDYGALGTTTWTGAPVDAVLDALDVTVPDGAWVMAAGADGPANDAGRVFARSIPVSKLRDDCLLAYHMAGSPIPLEHGFPVRLVVPGWYGTNSVKWLSELRVMDGMVRGDRWRRYSEWQQRHYRVLPAGATAREHATVDDLDTWAEIERTASGRSDGYPYVYDMTVKSLVARPGRGATRSSGEGTVEVVGVAWAGDDRVARVDVSTDGGETWHRARVFGPDAGPAAWRRFRYAWEPDPGSYTICSRATDDRGRTQPAEIADRGSGLASVDRGAFPWNQGGYASNAWRDLGVDVTVE